MLKKYPENVFFIHKLFRPTKELDKIYEENKGKYKVVKEILIEDLKNFIRPLRERKGEITEIFGYFSLLFSQRPNKIIQIFNQYFFDYFILAFIFFVDFVQLFCWSKKFMNIKNIFRVLFQHLSKYKPQVI